MGIESTRTIGREEAISIIQDYIEVKCKRMTNDDLDKFLHSLKYDLNVDIYANYIIKEQGK